MLSIDKAILKNCYMVTYSRLQKRFALVKMETGHIVKECDLFRGIYERIKQLKSNENIEIRFSDSAIDELQKRGFEREELPQVVGGV